MSTLGAGLDHYVDPYTAVLRHVLRQDEYDRVPRGCVVVFVCVRRDWLHVCRRYVCRGYVFGSQLEHTR